MGLALDRKVDTSIRYNHRFQGVQPLLPLSTLELLHRRVKVRPQCRRFKQVTLRQTRQCGSQQGTQCLPEQWVLLRKRTRRHRSQRTSTGTMAETTRGTRETNRAVESVLTPVSLYSSQFGGRYLVRVCVCSCATLVAWKLPTTRCAFWDAQRCGRCVLRDGLVLTSSCSLHFTCHRFCSCLFPSPQRQISSLSDPARLVLSQRYAKRSLNIVFLLLHAALTRFVDALLAEFWEWLIFLALSVLCFCV